MNPGRFRHDFALDTDLIVLAAYVGKTHIKVKGILVNRFNGPVYEKNTYQIRREHLKFWKPVRPV